MPTLSNDYTTGGSVTITLTSLDSDNWRQSTVVDNTTNKYIDAHVGGSIQTGTTPVAGGKIRIYGYATYNGTNYTAGCSGTDSAYTVSGEQHLLYFLEEIVVTATSDQDYEWGPVSIAERFGMYSLPLKWGIVVHQGSSVTTNATGTNNKVEFVGVKKTSA